ncbi:uncharacterized protein PAC_04854 [Phialocephala subalpina]|uniref:Mid2 domain-containing protein n=1 Tax=Phialocephala subalpina TaxID=576137 RepID=A0A1L7WQA6_9HELO|nr:uncharacterized protein PAC_04854 [Phialocephala subalpina]
MPRLSLQILLSFPFITSLVSATCYLPDGTLAPGAYRCNNATSGHSTCCEIGSVCWSNGVCQKVSNGVIDWIRLGCTDPTWNDPACLHACMSITQNALGVRPCDGIGGTNYCCDLTPNDPGDLSCCSTSAQLFSVPAATIEATVPAQKVIATSADISSLSSTASASTTMSTSATPTSNTASATSTSTSAAATSTNSGSSGLSTGAQAGIGVGVAAVAIGAGALGFLFWWRRRRNSNTYKPTSNNSSENGYGDDPSQWRGDQAYAAHHHHHNGGAWPREQNGYRQGAEYAQAQMAMQQAWNPMTPANLQTPAPPQELENAEKRSPVELGSTSDYHELETPKTMSTPRSG